MRLTATPCSRLTTTPWRRASRACLPARPRRRPKPRNAAARRWRVAITATRSRASTAGTAVTSSAATCAPSASTPSASASLSTNSPRRRDGRVRTTRATNAGAKPRRWGACCSDARRARTPTARTTCRTRLRLSGSAKGSRRSVSVTRRRRASYAAPRSASSGRRSEGWRRAARRPRRRRDGRSALRWRSPTRGSRSATTRLSSRWIPSRAAGASPSRTRRSRISFTFC